MKLWVYSAGPRRRSELFLWCGLISAEKLGAVERDREEVGQQLWRMAVCQRWNLDGQVASAESPQRESGQVQSEWCRALPQQSSAPCRPASSLSGLTCGPFPVLGAKH